VHLPADRVTDLDHVVITLSAIECALTATQAVGGEDLEEVLVVRIGVRRTCGG
jgi:hypothetical protein